MADAYDQFEPLLRENVASGVIDLQLDEDDVSWQFIDTFAPTLTGGRLTDAAGSDAGGSGYEAQWRIRLQRAGRVTGSSMTGNTLTAMGSGSLQFMGQAADTLYLDPAQTPLRAYQKIKMKLTRMKGQVTINRNQILADLATEPVAEVAFDSVVDAIWQVRHLWTSLFWSQGNGIMAIVDGAVTVGEGSSRAAVTVDAGTPFRFAEGQIVYTATVSSGAPTTGVQGNGASPTSPASLMRVIDINVEDRTVILESEAGEGDVILADNNCLVIEGMYDLNSSTNQAFQSVESLLIDSGVYPGSDVTISSTAHQKLRSFIDDNTASTVDPTPEKIAEMIDKITDANKMPPGLLIAEESVWSRYSQLEREGHALYTVPQGAQFGASGGVTGPIISHGTWAGRIVSSNKIRESSIIGMAPETFQKFMPLGNKALRWVMANGGVAGAGAIFRPVTSGRQLSEVNAADYDFFSQVGQTDPRRCFRMLGVNSQRSVNAA